MSDARVLTKRRPFAVKFDKIEADGTFEGYGSVFDVMDDGGDVVGAGAFADSLARHRAAGTMPAMLLQHDPERVVGTWLDIREDGHGLRCKGKFVLGIDRGRETYELMKANALMGLSIGYDTVTSERIDASPYADDLPMPPPQATLLKTLDLWEISVVTFPMNRHARADAVKRAPAQVTDWRAVAEALARRGEALRHVA